VALEVGRDRYARDIAPSRTFGFLRDLDLLMRLGLAKGGSLENALVIGEEGVLNGPLRFPDELVRHKILDLLGDLYLLGKPLVGTIIPTAPATNSTCNSCIASRSTWGWRPNHSASRQAPWSSGSPRCFPPPAP
jgi:UDP-3-O-acyl-N-acetylglucosamine deacetylase